MQVGIVDLQLCNYERPDDTYCGRPATLLCDACCSVSYCSDKCRVADHPKHDQHCAYRAQNRHKSLTDIVVRNAKNHEFVKLLTTIAGERQCSMLVIIDFKLMQEWPEKQHLYATHGQKIIDIIADIHINRVAGPRQIMFAYLIDWMVFVCHTITTAAMPPRIVTGRNDFCLKVFTTVNGVFALRLLEDIEDREDRED